MTDMRLKHVLLALPLLLLFAHCASTPQLTKMSVSDMQAFTDQYHHDRNIGDAFRASHYDSTAVWVAADSSHTTEAFGRAVASMRARDSSGEMSFHDREREVRYLDHMLQTIILTGK